MGAKQNQTKNSKTIFCNNVFLVKAFLALILGTVALTLNAIQVFILHSKAIPPLSPVYFPPIDSEGASACFASANAARLEPPANTFFWGFSPEWRYDGSLPVDVMNRLDGSNPATIWNTFIHTNGEPNNFSQNILEWNCQQVQKLGGILEISLQPDVRPIDIKDEFYTTLALFFRRMNSQYGVPILLRFMAEMNGNWMPYGMQPESQIAAWRKLSTAVRKQTNMTALVWSPNIGNGYPFRNGGMFLLLDFYRKIGYDFAIPTRGPDLRLLDTNRNGRVDIGDDPYLPYYPGDDIVDWIGISLYNFQRQNGQVIVSSPTVFTDPDSQESLFSRTFPFYSTFVTPKKKPFMFAETGSAVDYNFNGSMIVPSPPTIEVEISTKRAWWNLILSSALGPGASLPELKASVWFEIIKDEAAYQDPNQRVLRDYRVSANSSVAAVLIQDLNGRVTKPGKFKFDCSGRFSM